jgi:hypothetical protein
MKASSSLLLYPAYVQDYLDRVTAADVAAGNTLGLERGVTDAFNTCLQAMVADTSLGVSGTVLAQAASLIKASCAMQGARTLSGSLVPLAADMPAPTNFNFLAGDYNRRTGLVGDGGTKRLDSNRNNNADPRDDNHNAVYITTATTLSSTYMGASNATNLVGDNNFGRFSSNLFFRNRTSVPVNTGPIGAAVGLMGTSRSVPVSYIYRVAGVSAGPSNASQTPFNNNLSIFASGSASYSNGRLSFYSIGSALDLAILDARITALSNAIQAAITP